jgi:AcrR family transcriptional regulator
MTPPATATRTLSNAKDRREDIIRAAEEVFAERGIHGTPTSAVAKAAGISHAYLFRLFPTKDDLAVALVERCNARILETFRIAAARAKGAGEDVLPAMGVAYVELLQDRRLLLLMLHSYAAAASMPEIRDSTRRGFQRLVELAQRESGAPAEEIQRFFAKGMLINVLASMDAPAVDEPWARILMGQDC